MGDEKKKWKKKKGAGPHILKDGTVIKNSKVFEATEDELKGAMDKFVEV